MVTRLAKNEIPERPRSKVIICQIWEICEIITLLRETDLKSAIRVSHQTNIHQINFYKLFSDGFIGFAAFLGWCVISWWPSVAFSDLISNILIVIIDDFWSDMWQNIIWCQQNSRTTAVDSRNRESINKLNGNQHMKSYCWNNSTF